VLQTPSLPTPPVPVSRTVIYPKNVAVDTLKSLVPMADSDSALSEIVNITEDTLPDANTGSPQFYPAQLVAMEYIQGKAASVSTSSIPPPGPPTAAPVAAPVPVPVAKSPAEGSSLIPTAVHLAAWKKMAAKYSDARLQRHLLIWALKATHICRFTNISRLKR
jgi:hypothetical protein